MFQLIFLHTRQGFLRFSPELTNLILHNPYPTRGIDEKQLTTYVANTMYRNDPKFSDRYAWANSADPDQKEQSDQGLHCLPFRLHRLNSLLYGKAT